MADSNILDILDQGVEAWNKWRKENPGNVVDLSKVNLSGARLANADLSNANLSRADLSGADLRCADLNKANLDRACMSKVWLNDANLSNSRLFRANLDEARAMKVALNGAFLAESNLFRANFAESNISNAMLNAANLVWADLRGAILRNSDLTAAIMSGANLSEVIFTGSNLSEVNLVDANLESADLTDCRVYGISAWGVNLKNVKQDGLIITPSYAPKITVDNVEVAQFIYILLNNEKIRRVIDTITSKVVLILGRFSPERKAVLDAIKDELRKRDFVPVMFDFQKPDNRDMTETIRTLALMARFIIADITDPKSIPLELQAIVPDVAVPVQPLLLEGSSEFSMFQDLRRKYHWVLETYRYENQETLMATLEGRVIAPAEAKVSELRMHS